MFCACFLLGAGCLVLFSFCVCGGYLVLSVVVWCYGVCGGWILWLGFGLFFG